ncbi:MAG: hypothetical protein KDD36_12140 [Flavobacteriales bacterium]|nr:hypothetical protein [Flavobacteriales bacterium]
MAQKPIREKDAKSLLYRYFKEHDASSLLTMERIAGLDSLTDPVTLAEEHPWLRNTKLAVKPDQLIKRRGIHNLLALDVTYEEGLSWIKKYMNKSLCLDNVCGKLTHFVLEPFIPHDQKDEYYLCIQTTRWGDQIMFHHQGGIQVGDVDNKALKMMIKEDVSEKIITEKLLTHIPEAHRSFMAKFIHTTYKMFAEWHFAYLEINPLIIIKDRVIPLDMAAKLDDAARFLQETNWGKVGFPEPFGHEPSEEEQKIAALDENPVHP